MTLTAEGETVSETASAAGRTGPAIELINLSKSFGTVHAVANVCLSINRNEFFSILGPSGCGKTTLMRMITGFESPSAGRILLEGRDVASLPAHKRDLNMLFQSYALFPHLSVADNIQFELRVRRRKRTELRAAVEDALNLVRLPGYGDRRISELSGGQRQRVALARAVVSRPALVLLDEPLGALDQKLRQEMQLELKRMQREVGITFVYVTHDQEEALTMSDRIAVMSAGRVVQVATPEKLYGEPETAYVADFIGTSNILTGVVLQSAQGGKSIELESGIELTILTELPTGSAVDLILRPEQIELEPFTEHVPVVDARPRLTATLEAEIFLGTMTRYHVRTRDGKSLVVTRSNGGVGKRPTAQTGDQLSLAWHADRARVIPHA